MPFDGAQTFTSIATMVRRRLPTILPRHGEAGQARSPQFKRWYEQPGTPNVRVTESYADGNFSLQITQTGAVLPNADQQQPFHMPLAMGFVLLMAPASTCLLLISTVQRRRFFVTAVKPCGSERARKQVTINLTAKPVVSFLRGFPPRSKSVTSAMRKPAPSAARYRRICALGCDANAVDLPLRCQYDCGRRPRRGLGRSRQECAGPRNSRAATFSGNVLTVLINYLFEQLRGFSDTLLDAEI